MLEKLLKSLLSGSYDKDLGQVVPLVYDPDKKKASFTLLSAYVSLTLALASVIALHFSEQFKSATLITLGFWAAATTFYLLHGGISKAKIDLKDQEVELDTDPNTGESK
jgi:hypothetical protein